MAETPQQPDDERDEAGEQPDETAEQADEAAERPAGEATEEADEATERPAGEAEASTAPPAGVAAESGTDEPEVAEPDSTEAAPAEAEAAPAEAEAAPAEPDAAEPEPEPAPAAEPVAAGSDEAPVTPPADAAAAEGATPGAEEAALEDEGAGVEGPAPRARPDIPGADLEPDIVGEGDDPLRGREKPEIPGADLEPDIVVEGDDALTHGEVAAEGLVLEGEVEGVIERDGDGDGDGAPQAIAQAAIDLAAGARYRATGKRKTSIARVILRPGSGAYTVNGKTLEVFFPRPTLQRTIRQPLETVGYESRMDVVATIQGGGVSGQAGALRHGIARALIDADPNLRSELKRRGFLTRDARVKERKKAGLKKARKRPQFSKR
jgi:small subunit ribosomal protein S9